MKNNELKPAFSLIELIVSMSIIVMLTVLFLANYRDSNKRTDLVMTAQVMVTDIRYAQSNTLGLISYGDTFPPGGWGLYVSSEESLNNRYTIFADLNDNKLYNLGEADESNGGRTIFFPKNIQIKEINIEGGNVGDVSSADITFLPPDPTTRIRVNGSEVVIAHIVLENIASGDIRTVYVNFLGLIEVEE